MSNQEKPGFIQLIKSIPPTNEQRNDPRYIPQLEINQDAVEILEEQFESPISILVYMGNLGAGKSKLASLTVATLLRDNTGDILLPFKSGDDPRGITNGVWMWAKPVKDPKKKRGSILILDCEGMGGNDVTTNNNLYLFCMIVSSVLLLVLRPARIDRDQCDRLYEELRRFERMQSPCILPFTYLVPLELPVLKCNDRDADPDEWINKIFTVDKLGNTLATTQQQELQSKYSFIRKKLPKIDVANLTFLPHQLKDNNMALNEMRTTVTNESCKDFCKSLEHIVEKFLNTEAKRLPGSNTIPALLVRPVELVSFMRDLINIINKARDPKPNELISRCLFERFKHVIEKSEAEFQQEFLLAVAQYAKEKVKAEDTTFNPDEVRNILQEKRSSLTEKYINNLKIFAEKRIYGSGSILLSSGSFIECLGKTRTKLNSYTDPEELISKIRDVYTNTNDRTAQEEQKKDISKETEQKLKTLAERICREEMINRAIDGPELKCEAERCSKCNRQAAIISIIHKCTNGRQGNYYRYDKTQMVCDACRELAKISVTSISCASCGALRVIRSFIN